MFTDAELTQLQRTYQSSNYFESSCWSCVEQDIARTKGPGQESVVDACVYLIWAANLKKGLNTLQKHTYTTVSQNASRVLKG